MIATGRTAGHGVFPSASASVSGHDVADPRSIKTATTVQNNMGTSFVFFALSASLAGAAAFMNVDTAQKSSSWQNSRLNSLSEPEGWDDGDFDDPAALKRAVRAAPTMAEVRQLLAKGIKPSVWYDGNEPLF